MKHFVVIGCVDGYDTEYMTNRCASKKEAVKQFMKEMRKNYGVKNEWVYVHHVFSSDAPITKEED